MKIQDIRSLAEIMDKHGLTSMKINDGTLQIELEKQPAPLAAPASAPAVLLPPAAPAAQAAPQQPAQETAGVDFNNLKEIKAPMVGMFYTAPSPGAEPFVKVGSKVKKGDTLCIIEAIKLLNEITSDVDGEIVDICVNNGEVVEYGQTLYKIY